MTQEIPNPEIFHYGVPPIPPPPAKGMAKKTKVLLAVGAGSIGLMLCCCIGVVAAIGSDDKPDAPASSPALSSPAGTNPAATKAAVSPAAAPSPSLSPTAPAVPADKIFSGKGDKVVKLPKFDETHIYIATITHSGSGNFIVESIDSDGKQMDLLVNEIGKYSGTVPLTFSDYPAAVKINAGGAWKLTIKSLIKAPQWNGSVSGKGDAVYFIPAGTLDGLTSVKITHSGRSNFIVTTWSDGDRDLLVNEIGKYSGEVLIGDDSIVIEVNSDGAFTIAKS